MLKKSLRRAAILPIVVAALASTTAAAQGTTVSLGQPDLSARVLVTVPVTVSCAPFDPPRTLIGTGVSVTVEQGSGNGIAHGTGLTSGFLPTPLFACDGSEHTLSVAVLADPALRPFHGGPAVFSANVTISSGIPVSGCSTCFTDVQTQSSSVGPVRIHMH